MINIGDIVEYQYRGEKNQSFYGVIVGVSNDDYCWVEWFDLGIEKARKIILKGIDTMNIQIGDIVKGYGREGIVINLFDEYCFVHWFDNDYNKRYILPHHHTALSLIASSQ
jgi:hypothetical protein